MSFRTLGPVLAAIFAVSPLISHAQQPAERGYPAKPIRMVIPVVAGGPFDFLARTLTQKMPADMHFVIDNRPGSGTALGTDVVAKANADGYTLLLTSSTHASLPVIYKSLPYDAVKDFTPITIFAESVGFMLVVHPSVAGNLQDFINAAKANPGKFKYGSAGIGNASHFAAEIFNFKTGVQTTHIPYKGVVQLMPDLLSGRIEWSFNPATAFLQHVKAGRLNALGIAATNRWSEMPELPTLDEAGARGVLFAPWYGMWFPAGTPAAHVTRIRNEVSKVLKDPEVRRTYTREGFVPGSGALSSADITKRIIAEMEANRQVAARIGLKPE
jgi:tripartite-type tricarboxylate transporter receptor subunit TctC